MFPIQKSDRFRTEPPTMQIFTGVCRATLHPPVIGRLSFEGDAPIGSEGGARISVCRGIMTDSLPSESDTVGVVCLGAVPDGGIPSLPCLALGELPHTCHGRIALLDPSRGILFVSPDLKTVNRYSPLLARRHGRSSGSLCLSDGTSVGLCAMGSIGELIGAPDADGFCLSVAPPNALDEEGLYELCVDLAEGRADLPMTVSIPFDRRSDNHDSFRAQIRGLFRGAVFGSFSLLLEGILTREDLGYARTQIHRAFCELESEGRECNGYLPKGVRVDTPLLLGESLSVDGLDFVCIDLPRLVRGLVGATVADEALYGVIATRISAFLCRLADTKRTRLILDQTTLPSTLCALLRDWRIRELILPAPHFTELRQGIWQTAGGEKIFQ